MKAIVCVKQVPDTSGKVSVKPDGTLDRASMATITNPDDLNALEAALKLKDATGCEVVVVTMGPPPAEGMLRELLARGADKAVLVSGREFGGSDTFATSQILAAAVNKIGVGPEDVVFCGRQAIDGDTAQVGPQIAEKLHLPQVTYVADIQKDGNTLAARTASDVTRRCLQLFGGYGYTRDYPIERMMRDAKITEIYEGTSEVQMMVISGALLK